MKRTRLTVRSSRNGWAMTGGPHDMEFKAKLDALRAGREYARRMRPSQLTIRGRDGRIQTEHTYGADPRRRKG